ncbi:DUF2063 domain-containing protein [Sphingomonas suaedae]|uniref:DUF2063 domain-containing protein n=1 Tax=Sphingomonas suaedae TaxID=2599297 RepID=A0A518RHH5_9SPHN|nr:DNA-binding domain-containing protein [Sphingomonas suaedae]QDX26896.1 DUF2063 domain-containing protein [Sphingomonas suaedae]
MNLRSLQTDIQAWLTREDAQAARRLGSNAGPGLRVYQNNYRAQLIACLEGSFARTRAWLGAEAFLAAAATHVDRVPPSSWTLDAYPLEFPDTLTLLYPHDNEVVELAWIDWAIEDVFTGPDAVAMCVADLPTIDWDRATLWLVPARALRLLSTNAADIWQALVDEETPPTLEAGVENAGIVVWRKDHVARYRKIDRDEFQALCQLEDSLRFAELCDAAVARFGERAGIGQAGTWLGRWASDGLILVTEDPD